MHRVLVNDVTGRPVNLVPWSRAVTMVWEDAAHIVETDGSRVVRSPSIEIPLPLIIQTYGYVPLKPLKDGKIIRRVLYARDDYECQYCGADLDPKSATIDHVKPRVAFEREGRPRSDAHVWTNVTTACEKCNTRKGDRLPYECGMYPKKTPKKPTMVQTIWAGRKFHPIQAEYVSMYHHKEIDIAQLKVVDL